MMCVVGVLSFPNGAVIPLTKIDEMMKKKKDTRQLNRVFTSVKNTYVVKSIKFNVFLDLQKNLLDVLVYRINPFGFMYELHT